MTTRKKILSISQLYSASQVRRSDQSFFKRVVDPGNVTTVLLKNINLDLFENEVLGLVGESGSGKSLTVKAILGLHHFEPGIVNGSISYFGNPPFEILKKDLFDENQITQQEESLWQQTTNLAFQWHTPVTKTIRVPLTFAKKSPFTIYLYKLNGEYEVLDQAGVEWTSPNEISVENNNDFTHAFVAGFIWSPWANNQSIEINKRLKEYKSKNNVSFPGRKVSIIFQDPKTFLNPHWSIGRQLLNIDRLSPSDGVRSRNQAGDPVLASERIKYIAGLMGEYGLEYEKVKSALVEELSGGQIQRIMIVLSALAKPEILIADEPTTGLDVIVKRDIVNRFVENKDQSKIFISHDINMVRKISSRINVMLNGEMIENCDSDKFNVSDKHHPYTKKLLEIQNSHFRSTIKNNHINDTHLNHGCPFGSSDCEFMNNHRSLCENISPPARDAWTGEFVSETDTHRHWVKCWAINELD